MLLITCPHCGARDEVEFRYGGAAHIARPENPGDVSDDEWAAYLFVRNNPKGRFAERWMHRDGCRKWFNMVRDTVTHEILATYKPGEPRPELVENAETSRG